VPIYLSIYLFACLFVSSVEFVLCEIDARATNLSIADLFVAYQDDDKKRFGLSRGSEPNRTCCPYNSGFAFQ